MQEGDEFVNFKASKAAMQDWAMVCCGGIWARGRPKVARLTAGEQRARVAAFNMALQNIPDRQQRCSRCHQE